MRGHIHKRQWKGRGDKVQTLWYAVVDVGQADNGRRKQKWHGGFKTRREAEQELTRIVGSLERQTYIAPQRLTLADFARNQWLPLIQSQLKASTWHSYTRNLELHVLPVLGVRPMQAITAGHLNALYQSLLVGGKRNGNCSAPRPGSGTSSGGWRHPRVVVEQSGERIEVANPVLGRGL